MASAISVVILALVLGGCGSANSGSGREFASAEDVKTAAAEFPLCCPLEKEYDNNTGYHLRFACAPGPHWNWDYGFHITIVGENGYDPIETRWRRDCNRYTQDIKYVDSRAGLYDKVPFIAGENWTARVVGLSADPPTELTHANLASTLNGSIVDDPYDFCEVRFGMTPKEFVGK